MSKFPWVARTPPPPQEESINRCISSIGIDFTFLPHAILPDKENGDHSEDAKASGKLIVERLRQRTDAFRKRRSSCQTRLEETQG